MEDVYQKVVFYAKKIADNNLVCGSGGNISVRKEDEIYISSSGAKFSDLKKEKVSVINLDGHKVSGEFKASCEWRMHLECFRQREDISCVVHTHPIYATVLGYTKKQRLPVSYEVISAIENKIKSIEYLTPGSEELAERVGEEVKKSEILILTAHGVVTVGKAIEDAVDKSICVEREAKRWMLTKIFSKLDLLDKEVMAGLNYFIEL